MENLVLSFASRESSLSVRTFSVVEGMSRPFELSIVARSPEEDLDLDALVGEGAGLRVAGAQTWTGVVGHAEQVDVEPDGLSTYFLRIVPALSRTQYRRNNRIFQHLSVPEIAQKLLGEWEIEPILELELGQFPKLEYRVQYGETDFAFFHRMLEEAGISYCFRAPDADVKGKSELVLCADPTTREAGAPLNYVNNLENAKGGPAVTQVKISHQARPGRFTVRDHDFRTRPDFQLIADALLALPDEDRYELYHYDPGSFVVDPGRVDEREGKNIAQRRLAGVRQGRRTVTMRTTALDIGAGQVICMEHHPRADLAPDKRLLVIERTLEGTSEGEWSSRLTAVFASEPFRPVARTTKPRMGGLQSAVVVGPAGEEIHTDEHGRVRVQFHWDREGKYTDDSSCWIRVSQGWAGRGFGSVTIPRVGQEVLVDFLEGDPDQPVVIGRVYNGTAPFPYRLPENKTKSTWKSDSTPGSGGFNEITFDDAAGREKVFMHAQKDLEEVVREKSSVQIGKALDTKIGESETRNVTDDQTLQVGGNRVARVDGTDVLVVGTECRIQVGQVGASLSQDRVVFSTGKASITLAGGDIFLDASGSIKASSAGAMGLAGSAVKIDGLPNVLLNTAGAAPPVPIALTAQDLQLPEISLPDVTTLLDKALQAPIFDEIPGGFDEEKLEGALKSLLQKLPASIEDAPSFLMMPEGIEKQIQDELQKILDTPGMVVGTILDKVAAEQKKIEDTIAGIRERAGEVVGDIKEKIAGAVEDLRARAEAGKQLAIAKFNEIKGRLEAARDQIKAKVEELRGRLEEAKARAVALVEQMKGRLEAAKNAVMGKVNEIKERFEDAKARVAAKIDEIKGRIESIKEQAKAKIDEIKGRIESIKEQAKETIETMKERVMALKEQAVERFQEMKKQATEILEQAKSQVEAAKARVQELKARIEGAKEQVKQKWTELKGKVEEIKAQAKAKVEEVKAQARAVVENVKQQVENAKEQAKQVLGDAKHMVDDAKEQVKEVWGETKDAWNQTKDEAKAAWNQTKDEAKGAWNEAKDEWKHTKDEAKDAWNQTKTEAKDAWNQTKTEAKDAWNQTKTEAKDAWNQTKDEAKDAWNQTKTEAKDAWNQTKDEAKDAWNQSKGEAKDAWNQAQSEAKDAWKDAQGQAKELGSEAKDAFGDMKQGAQDGFGGLKDGLGDGLNQLKSAGAPGGGGGSPGGGLNDALGSMKQALSGGQPQAPGGMDLGQGANFLRSASPMSGSGGGGGSPADAGSALGQIYSRAGGFTGNDVASAVNGANGATIFQSPNEGQLLIMKTQDALPLNGKDVSAHLVDAQMGGVRTTDAFAESLSQKGYAVYERPWGALGEAFVKRAVL